MDLFFIANENGLQDSYTFAWLATFHLGQQLEEHFPPVLDESLAIHPLILVTDRN